MNAVEALRALTALELMETAARLEVRTGAVAAKFCRQCWDTLAEMENGSHCEESAHTLVLSAEKWMAA